MSRTLRAPRAEARFPGRGARRAAAALVALPALAALVAGSMSGQAAAQAAAVPALGGEVPWLFLTVVFVAAGCAFYAWGRLSERLATARRESRAPAPGAALQGPATRETAGAAAPNGAPMPVSGPLGAQAWLDALPGVAVLVEPRASGPVVWGLNAAAREHWPQAAPGTPVNALAGLATASRVMQEGLAAGAAVTFDGWRFAALSAGVAADVGGAPACWMLVSQASSATDADVFGSTLSHDLRAPIRVVEGFTRIVKEDYGEVLDRVGNDHLDRVLGAAARMNLMIDALLTMARLSAQPLARQPVDLSQLAQFVVDDLRRSGAAREVDVEVEPGLRASGDPTLLRLVLENLIGNAWKYTARADRARISLRAAQHEGRRAFAVADNGAGFDMRSADRLFGLFQRLHSASDFPGHGVGLASVRRIVNRHGGDIWAEGRPGQGATFTFTLG